MGWGEKDGGGERERKIKDGEGKEANKWELRGEKNRNWDTMEGTNLH